jgi:hypothetical protein
VVNILNELLIHYWQDTGLSIYCVVWLKGRHLTRNLKVLPSNLGNRPPVLSVTGEKYRHSSFKDAIQSILVSLGAG